MDAKGEVGWLSIAMLMFVATIAGVAARLGHQWAKAVTTPGARQLSWVDAIAALLGAPVMGFVGFGLARWRGFDIEIAAGICAFGGLLGPSVLFMLYEVAQAFLKAKVPAIPGPKDGG